MKDIILKDIIQSEDYQLDTVQQYQKVVKLVRKLNDMVSAYEKKIKAEAKEVFDKDDKLMKIDVEGFTATRVRKGYKTPERDLAEMYADGVIGIEIDYKMNTNELNDYVKKNGKLPEGWYENVKEYIYIDIDEDED